MTVQATYGPSRNKRTFAYAITAAAMVTGMLVAQLFGYEDFATVLSSLVPVNDARSLALIAGVIVMLELLALPYLLGMFLSKLMRAVSGGVSFGVASFWLFTAFTNAHANNSGLFSSTVELGGGIIAACWSLLLLGLVCKVIYADSRFRHATS